jgi:RimJ/RimL family protein N-acetyltransferase
LRKELEEVSTPGGASLVANADLGNEESLKVLKKLGFQMVEHRKLGGPERFLAGQWREDGYLILSRDLRI